MPTDKTTVKITTLQGVYAETTVDGQPESVTMNGLQAATAYRAQAFHDNDGLQSTSNIVSFNTLPAEQYTFGTPVYTRGSNGEHIVTWTYTSVYALTTAIMNDGHGNNWQGVIDSNAGTLTFTMEQSEWACCGTSYLCTVTVYDIYTIMGRSPSTTIVTNTYNALVTTFVSSTATTATVQVTKHMDSTPVSVWVDCWYPGSDPSTDPADETEFLAAGSDTVTFNNLTENTQYTFRAGASIDLQTSVYGNAVQGSTQAGPLSTPLTFTALEDNVPIGFRIIKSYGDLTSRGIQYSTDGGNTWNVHHADAVTSFFCTLNNGEQVQIKGSNQSYASADYYCKFMSNGKRFAASGNINSLVNYSQSFDTYCYSKLFESCTGLVTPPLLPSTTLTDNCYYQMFAGCTSLTTSPALPATTLGIRSCKEMFLDCTSLTTVPSFSATTLSNFCCEGMFSGCTSLASVPQLPATTLAHSCYKNMFAGCTSLTTAPALPSSTLANSCYMYMFSGCTSLTSAPSLSAASLPNYCYDGMFSGCTSLTTAPSMSNVTTIGSYSMENMFSECTALTTAPSMANVTSVGLNGMNSMFSGCTSLTAAPSLPSATTAGNRAFASAFAGCTALVTGCDIRTVVTNNKYPNAKAFENMYYGCTRLSTVYCADLQANAEMSDNWLGDVSASGTVICPSQTALDQLPAGSPHGIPSGWTAVVQAP